MSHIAVRRLELRFEIEDKAARPRRKPAGTEVDKAEHLYNIERWDS
jgi:hypothetical protein